MIVFYVFPIAVCCLLCDDRDVIICLDNGLEFIVTQVNDAFMPH